MASFDIVSKVDVQTLDNAINVAKKDLANRYDLKGTDSEIELDKKGMNIKVTSNNDMNINTIVDIILSRMIKQGIEANSLDMTKEIEKSGAVVKKELSVKSGIDKEIGKKINKEIKDSKIKVSSSIMDDSIRVTSKKIDDLQEVIAYLKQKDFGQPLQFNNFKS